MAISVYLGRANHPMGGSHRRQDRARGDPRAYVRGRDGSPGESPAGLHVTDVPALHYPRRQGEKRPRPKDG